MVFITHLYTIIYRNTGCLLQVSGDDKIRLIKCRATWIPLLPHTDKNAQPPEYLSFHTLTRMHNSLNTSPSRHWQECTAPWILLLPHTHWHKWQITASWNATFQTPIQLRLLCHQMYSRKVSKQLNIICSLKVWAKNNGSPNCSRGMAAGWIRRP